MKTKIAALITALLIIFIGAGGVYYISQSSPEVKGVVDTTSTDGDDALPENQSVRYMEELTDTRVEDWLKGVGNKLELDIINISDGSFKWKTEIGEEDVRGKSLIVNSIVDGTLDSIFELFEIGNYLSNDLNTVEEEDIQIYGFEKEDIVCLLKTPTVSTVSDLEVRCGLIDPKQITIKKLISEQLEIDSSTIFVDIIQSSSDHMSGSVQIIEPDEEASAQNNVEAFLAAKDEEGAWVLVYMGNEKIMCGDIEPYNFPIEMLPECFDEEINTMIERIMTDETADETVDETTDRTDDTLLEKEVETDQTTS